MGRLTRDPELKTLNNGVEVCSASLAVDRRTKKEDGKREVDFVPVVFWRQQATFVAKYFHKGSRIAISGRIQVRSYEDSEGKKRTATEVVCEDVYFAESASQAPHEATQASGGEYEPKFYKDEKPGAQTGFVPISDEDISLPFDLDQ
jgi:single-strand DNA-binding protein